MTDELKAGDLLQRCINIPANIYAASMFEDQVSSKIIDFVEKGELVYVLKNLTPNRDMSTIHVMCLKTRTIGFVYLTQKDFWIKIY